jgi:hypothetical protein
MIFVIFQNDRSLVVPFSYLYSTCALLGFSSPGWTSSWGNSPAGWFLYRSNRGVLSHIMWVCFMSICFWLRPIDLICRHPRIIWSKCQDHMDMKLISGISTSTSGRIIHLDFNQSCCSLSIQILIWHNSIL